MYKVKLLILGIYIFSVGTSYSQGQSKYGNDSENVLFLDKLGSTNWKKRKNKAKKKIIEVAKKLIKIASSRLKSESYNINTNHIDYDKFCSTFQYVETDDQTNSIQDIIQDVEKKHL